MRGVRNNIKAIRARLGLSQEAFGEGVGVSQGNISHYEMQRQEVPPDVARSIIAFASIKGETVTFDDIYRADGAEDDVIETGRGRLSQVGAGATAIKQEAA